jgi:S-adenosylmethionine/arginine decarboxylase-like enzyme
MKHYTCKVLGDVSDATAEQTALLLKGACEAAGTTVIQQISHKFDRQGFSTLLLLSESHCSYHSWPEHGFALIDYFSCADDPKIEIFEAHLRRKFEIKEPVVLLR